MKKWIFIILLLFSINVYALDSVEYRELDESDAVKLIGEIKPIKRTFDDLKRKYPRLFEYGEKFGIGYDVVNNKRLIFEIKVKNIVKKVKIKVEEDKYYLMFDF